MHGADSFFFSCSTEAKTLLCIECKEEPVADDGPCCVFCAEEATQIANAKLVTAAKRAAAKQAAEEKKQEEDALKVFS